MNHADVDPTWQFGMLGVLLLIAVMLDEFVLRRPARAPASGAGGMSSPTPTELQARATVGAPPA